VGAGEESQVKGHVEQQTFPTTFTHTVPEPQLLSEVQLPEQLPKSTQRAPEPRCCATHVPDESTQMEELHPELQGEQEPQLDGIVVVVVVVVGMVVVVVVVGAGQLGRLPGAGQASQQLVHVPTVPFFAVQRRASASILHFVPVVVVKQHVTKPGLPQVECAAHFFTTPAQLLLTRNEFACCTAQLT
jgi:hypothetical protein